MNKILVSMLTENTGRSFLDSGGAYGRNFERNQGKDFEAVNPASVEFSIYNGKLQSSVTLDVYHWLNRRVCYDAKMQARLKRFSQRKDMQDESWFTVVESFLEVLKERGCEVTGLYGEGKPMTVNTYNHESCLSQVLQYTYAQIDSTVYYFLTIHGGCDVRGGYTAPRVFTSREQDEDIFDDARCSLYEVLPSGKWGMSWRSDDAGYHWYGDSYAVELPLFGKQTYADAPKLENMPCSDDESLIGDGVHLIVTADGNAYLPNGNRLEVAE